MEHIQRRFAEIEARLLVRPLAPRRRDLSTFDLNVGRDKQGEYFLLRTGREMPELRVLQANRLIRHLLLHVAGEEGGERFLCGFDERHLFVAGVEARVSTITAAKAALLPLPLREAGLTPADLARRRNATFIRQGEWFFVPVTQDLSKYPIHRQEPLVRSRTGKPHVVAELVRFGGTTVMLAKGREYSMEEWAAMRATNPHEAIFGRQMTKDPETYARGPVRHPDHATVLLGGWHRVFPNRESRSINLSFYD